jgi:hypothetical protein
MYKRKQTEKEWLRGNEKQRNARVRYGGGNDSRVSKKEDNDDEGQPKWMWSKGKRMKTKPTTKKRPRKGRGSKAPILLVENCPKKL